MPSSECGRGLSSRGTFPELRRDTRESSGVSLVSLSRCGAYRWRMAEYLVELYLSREDSAAVVSGSARARAAAEELSGEGEGIRYVRAIFAPEDETCFFLYEADSAGVAREAARRAGLRFVRVTEVLGAPREQEACL